MIIITFFVPLTGTTLKIGKVLEIKSSHSGLPMRNHKRANHELEHKVVEKAYELQESGFCYRSILDSLVVGVLIIDPETHVIIDANETAVKMIGVSRDEILGKECQNFLCLNDRGQCPVTDLNQVVDCSERSILKKDGTELPVLKSVKKVEINGRQLLVESFFDISELRRIREALEDSEKRNLTLTQESNDGIIIVQDNVIKFANSKILELTGYSLKEGLGKDFRDFVAPEYRQIAYEKYIKRLSSDRSIDKYEIEILSKDGKRIPVEVSGSLMELDGKPASMMIIKDLTEQKRAESEIKKRLEIERHIKRKLHEKTKELSRQNEEFNAITYAIAHDLKAHALSIQVLSTLLSNDIGNKLSEDSKVYIKRILDNSELIGELIEGLLELTEIGKVRDRISLIDVEEIVLEILGRYSEEIQQRNIRTTVNRPLPKLWGDRREILTIFEKLIDNAIKFMGRSQTREIEIGSKDPGDPSYVTFYVKDTGIGIDKEYHEKVFQILQRLEEVDEKGVGLGLTIAKKAVESMHGKIWIESEKGKGTTVYFSMPSGQSRKPIPEPNSDTDPPSTLK